MTIQAHIARDVFASQAVADAIKAAAEAAANEVTIYSHRYDERKQYRPLELLARRVEEAARSAAIESLKAAPR